MSTGHPPVIFAALFRALSDAWMKGGEGRTLQALADLVGVDNSLLSHWKAGRTSPDPRGDALPRLCAALGLTLEQSRQVYGACGVDLSPVLSGDPGDPAPAGV